jgi:hypothetical protein
VTRRLHVEYFHGGVFAVNEWDIGRHAVFTAADARGIILEVLRIPADGNAGGRPHVPKLSDVQITNVYTTG